jgi:hypothetical protein
MGQQRHAELDILTLAGANNALEVGLIHVGFAAGHLLSLSAGSGWARSLSPVMAESSSVSAAPGPLSTYSNVSSLVSVLFRPELAIVAVTRLRSAAITGPMMSASPTSKAASFTACGKRGADTETVTFRADHSALLSPGPAHAFGGHPPAGRDRTQGEEIVTPLADAPDIELIRRIAATGGRKYTARNIDRRKYQRLVALGWLTEVSVNISDVLYEVTDAGKVAALRDD